MTNGLLPPGEGGLLNEIMSNSKDSGETLTLRCLFYREQVSFPSSTEAKFILPYILPQILLIQDLVVSSNVLRVCDVGLLHSYSLRCCKPSVIRRSGPQSILKSRLQLRKPEFETSIDNFIRYNPLSM